MYEHPIKRAGLTFNRILYSNTQMAYKCFPESTSTRFSFGFMQKKFENGKEI